MLVHSNYSRQLMEITPWFIRLNYIPKFHASSWMICTKIEANAIIIVHIFHYRYLFVLWLRIYFLSLTYNIFHMPHTAKDTIDYTINIKYKANGAEAFSMTWKQCSSDFVVYSILVEAHCCLYLCLMFISIYLAVIWLTSIEFFIWIVLK